MRRAWAICAALASAAAVVALMLYLRAPSARPSPPKRPAADSIVHQPSSPPVLANQPKLQQVSLARFAAEPVAPTWAAEQAQQLRTIVAAALEDLSPGAEIADLECRSSHCRFILLGRDTTQLSSAIAALEDHAPLRSLARSMHLADLRHTPPVQLTILLDMTSPASMRLAPD